MTDLPGAPIISLALVQILILLRKLGRVTTVMRSLAAGGMTQKVRP